MPESTVEIVEKPDSISWDRLHEIIWEAHSVNRARGIVMRNPSLSGEEIRKRIEGKGRFFVAMIGGEPIGTAAYIEKNLSRWCGKGRYAYLCFDSLLPDFQKRGIYPRMCAFRDSFLAEQGFERFILDTNENNTREIEIARRTGFHLVDYSIFRDHCNVVMVKWPHGCPYPAWWCNFRFRLLKTYKKLRMRLRKKKR